VNEWGLEVSVEEGDECKKELSQKLAKSMSLNGDRAYMLQRGRKSRDSPRF